MLLGLDRVAMAQSAEEDTGMTKGLYIGTNGIDCLVSSTTDYIQVAGSTSITACLNSKTVNMYLIEFDAGHNVNDYWNITSTRTFTVKAATAYIRFTVEDGYDGAYVKNNTTGDYIYKDGRLVNGGGCSLVCARSPYSRSWRPSARFCAPPRWEVAA